MVVYYFYRRKTLYKFKPIEVYQTINHSCLRVIIDPLSDPRMDTYKDSMVVSGKEGVVRYGNFWLEEEDDERAMRIWEDYKKEKVNQLQLQINKINGES